MQQKIILEIWKYFTNISQFLSEGDRQYRMFITFQLKLHRIIYLYMFYNHNVSETMYLQSSSGTSQESTFEIFKNCTTANFCLKVDRQCQMCTTFVFLRLVNGKIWRFKFLENSDSHKKICMGQILLRAKL